MTQSRRLAHLPFAVVLTLGIVLRALAVVAYRPILLFPDSMHYISSARSLSLSRTRPAGISFFYSPFMHGLGGTQGIAIAQHLLVVLLAVFIYLLLLRRNIPAWAATLGVLPLLLDPMQVVLEHYALSDTLFELLVTTGCVVLLWRRRPTITAVVVSALCFGLCGLVRGAGAAMLAVFVVAAVALRVRPRWLVLALVAVAIPYAGYVVGYHAQHGRYALVESGPRFLYARIAPVADCTGVAMPAYERQLCPTEPVGHRPTSDYYMWGHHKSAQYHLVLPRGRDPLAVIHDFDKRIVRAQPGVLARQTVRDFLYGFHPSRNYSAPGFFAGDWQFHTHYWSLDRFIAAHTVSPMRYKLSGVRDDPDVGRVLTAYGHFYVPGPLLFALLVAAVLAVLGLGRSRRSGNRVAAGLLGGACAASLLVTAALSGMSWRYQLPQLALLGPAGVLAVAALAGRGADDTLATPPSVLADVAQRVRLGYVTVGLILSVVAALLLSAGAVVTGWARPSVAAALGGAALVVLLVSLARAARNKRGSEEQPDTDER